jgi:hypothetical protein
VALAGGTLTGMTNDVFENDYLWPHSEAARTAMGHLPAGSPVLFELVGSITTTGAYIEDALRGIFCWLAEPSPKLRGPWQLLSNGQSFVWLVDYCIAMGELRHKEAAWWPALHDGIKQAKVAMEQQRNPVVHASFTNDGQDSWATRSRLKKTKPDRFPATAEELRERYRSLAMAQVRLVTPWFAAVAQEEKGK